MDSLCSKQVNKTIDGHDAFVLYDTYGFPLDLTKTVAQERGFNVDETGYQQALKAQQKRGKQASIQTLGDWQKIQEGNTTFVGYEHTQIQTKILQYRNTQNSKGKHYEIVLEHTPFYAEGGGQVGDTGYLIFGKHKVEVIDTQRAHTLILHTTKYLPQDITAPCIAQVDKHKRLNTQKNHTATHLLHATLRQQFGKNIEQRGSKVTDVALRFDFSHPKALTPQEINHVEHNINAIIRKNAAVEILHNVPLQEAKTMGASALFGEKYGDKVRVVRIDNDFSLELCGGTHVKNTQDIGYFKIQNEQAIASGIRRIEAITGNKAWQYIEAKLEDIAKAQKILNTQTNITEAINKALNELKSTKKHRDTLEKEALNGLKEKLSASTFDIRKGKAITAHIQGFAVKHLKALAFDIAKNNNNLVVILCGVQANKALLSVYVGDNLIKRIGTAPDVCNGLAKLIKGKGGGQKNFAMAGGTHTKGIADVIKAARKILT